MKVTLPQHLLSKKNRALLAELVRTDFKLRYQGSILGILWSVLKPLALFFVMYMVFVRFFEVYRWHANISASITTRYFTMELFC